MAKVSGNETFSANLINAGTLIKGDVECQGDIRFDGILSGNLTTKGKLVIGSNGNVKGEIICSNCDIEGTVEGKITVVDLLSLKSTSRFAGNVLTSRIAIEPGAFFNGTCAMRDRNAVTESEKSE